VNNAAKQFSHPAVDYCGNRQVLSLSLNVDKFHDVITSSGRLFRVLAAGMTNAVAQSSVP